MIERKNILVATRGCLGTPYHHQGRLVGVGLDCAGLIQYVAAKVGLKLQDVKVYSRYADGVALKKMCDENLIPSGKDPLPGDVLLFWIDNPKKPQHLGIMSCYGMIHTYSTIGKTIEHTWNKTWKDRLVCSYQFPDVEQGWAGPMPGDPPTDAHAKGGCCGG